MRQDHNRPFELELRQFCIATGSDNKGRRGGRQSGVSKVSSYLNILAAVESFSRFFNRVFELYL
jgi:hypothetical protein